MTNKPKPDKYSAVWVSHSSMGDFIKCPRAYYLHNIYKNPTTNRKMNIVTPATSLGSAVHEVLEGLINFKAEDREKQSLTGQYEEVWPKYAGKNGGFLDKETEAEYKERGLVMLDRVKKNFGPLKNKAIKLKEHEGGMPPNYYLSEDDNIILCGLIDWLEYLPETDSLHVLDFKTGKHEEKEGSLQLPIYLLLLSNLQKRSVTKASYWYLGDKDKPEEKPLPTLEEARKRVLKVAKEVKEARLKNDFKCPRGSEGCFACTPFEKILKGEAEYVGVGGYGQDIYLV